MNKSCTKFPIRSSQVCNVLLPWVDSGSTKKRDSSVGGCGVGVAAGSNGQVREGEKKENTIGLKTAQILPKALAVREKRQIVVSRLFYQIGM